jgi:hypothetical protein
MNVSDNLVDFGRVERTLDAQNRAQHDKYATMGLQESAAMISARSRNALPASGERQIIAASSPACSTSLTDCAAHRLGSTSRPKCRACANDDCRISNA